MASMFDPSQLSPADQGAFSQWQQQLQQYVAKNGGAIPAPVSYALAHPEYLQQHPELQADYDIVSGAQLPDTTKSALAGYHPQWGGDSPGMAKDSGLMGKWETWLQLGLGAAVAAPAIAGAMGAAGAGAAGSAGAAAPALEGGATLAGNLGGAGALGAGGSAASTAAGGGLLSKAGSILKGKAGDILGAAGSAIGAASDAAGKNRMSEAELNMRGNYDYEQELNNRTRQDAAQRNNALDDVYRNSWYQNRTPSPYNTKGITPMNQQFMDTLAGLADQGATKLGHVSQYDSDVVKPLQPYVPTKKGLLENVGTWAGPILSGASTIGRILRK